MSNMTANDIMSKTLLTDLNRGGFLFLLLILINMFVSKTNY